ncbi:MAG: hemagglutinin repeat-containing protein [Alphaproteobacteria bacterium]|nr:hemagglutinin repeat-containing protein [Alphaproteobacteria bacterium]
MLNAANDITIKGSDAQSAGDINLTAQNVTIGAETESYHYHETSSSHGFMSSSKKEVKQDKESLRGSTLTAGNNININANDDINVTASYAEAGNDIHLLADADHNNTGGITVEAGKGYESSYVYKKDSGFTGGLSGMSFGVSYQQTKDKVSTYRETLLPSMMLAGHDIAMDAADDITIKASHLQAGNDVKLTAGNDINIVSDGFDDEHHESHTMSSIGVSVAIQESLTGAIDSIHDLSNTNTSGDYGAVNLAANAYKGWYAYNNLGGVSNVVNNPSSLLPSLSISLGISSSSSKYDQTGTNHMPSTIQAGHDFISSSGNDTTIKGATILAQNVNMDVGGDLLVSSVQNTSETSKSEKSGGMSVGVSIDIMGNVTPTFGANVYSGSGKGHRNWTDDVTSIMGTNSVAIDVGGKTTINGAMIAQATPQEDGSYKDGSNLTLYTGSLEVANLVDEDVWHYSGAGLAAGWSFGGNNGGTGTPAKPVAGTNTSLPSSLTPSVRIDDDKTIGITHATVGEGTITINGEPATTDELNDLNRDVNNVQEIIKDEHNSLDIEIPIDGKTLTIAVTFIGDAAASLSDKLSAVFDQAIDQAVDQNMLNANSKDNVKAVMEALKDGEITPEQLTGCDEVSFNIRSLFVADAYAASMCHIELKSGTIVISKSDQDFANKLYQETLKTPSIGSLYADEGLIAFDNVCNADPTCRVANQDASFKALALAGITVSVFGVAGLAGGGAAGTDGFLLGEGDGLFLSAQQLELKIQTSAASLAQFLTNAYITNTLSGLDPNNPMMGTSGNNGIDLEGYSSHDGSTLPKDSGLSFPGYDNTLPGFEIPTSGSSVEIYPGESDYDNSLPGFEIPYTNGIDIFTNTAPIDLTQEEGANGGHTIEMHVGKSDDFLIDRLSNPFKYNTNQDSITGASTFPDIETANTVVNDSFAQNNSQIQEWLNTPGSKQLSISYTGTDVIGKGIYKGDTSVMDLTNARIVLVKNGTGGFGVKTAYPIK